MLEKCIHVNNPSVPPSRPDYWNIILRHSTLTQPHTAHPAHHSAWALGGLQRRSPGCLAPRSRKWRRIAVPRLPRRWPPHSSERSLSLISYVIPFSATTKLQLTHCLPSRSLTHLSSSIRISFYDIFFS